MTCTSSEFATVDAEIPAGAVSPYAVRYDVTSEDPLIDLSLIVSAQFEIRRQSGERETWTAAIDGGSQSATFLRLQHLLQASDVPIANESIRIFPILNGPLGEVYYAPARLIKVIDPFATD